MSMERTRNAIMNISAKSIAVLLILGELCFFGGAVAFAETAPESATAVPSFGDPLPVPPDTFTTLVASTTDDVVPTADLQGASSTPLLQETFTEQGTVPSDQVPADAEIVLATSTDETLPVSPDDPSASSTPDGTTENASTTPDVTLEDATTTPVEDVPPQDELQPEVQQPLPHVDDTPTVISREELKPNPKYMFAINTAKHIPTTHKTRRSRPDHGKAAAEDVTEVASAPPAIVVDNTTGVMNVSGTCSNRYYVILVYKNASDYAISKNLYIVNRAFLCENGAYSYDIVNLPQTLEDGTYYLLVGGMEEDKPWEPMTSLTEITLHRNN